MSSNRISRTLGGRPRLAVERLEDRCLPATNLFAVGAGPGAPPHVKVYDAQTRTEVFGFLAYDPRFLGGVRVAVGDFNGDGQQDIITGAGPGAGPHVRVFDGVTLGVLANFYAYDPGFAGGVTVAGGRFNLLNGLGAQPALVTGAGAGAGGGHIKAFSPGLAEVASFFAFDAGFLGGVSVSTGNTTGRDSDSVVVGAGPGAAGGHVKVYGPRNSFGPPRDNGRASIIYEPFAELRTFFAFDAGYLGGVSVAAGNVDEFGGADIVVGAAVPGGHVKVFSNEGGAEVYSFRPFASAGSTWVATADVTGDSRRDLLVSSSAPALGAPQVRVFDAVSLAPVAELFPFGTSYTGGVYVGAAGS